MQDEYPNRESLLNHTSAFDDACSILCGGCSPTIGRVRGTLHSGRVTVCARSSEILEQINAFGILRRPLGHGVCEGAMPVRVRKMRSSFHPVMPAIRAEVHPGRGRCRPHAPRAQRRRAGGCGISFQRIAPADVSVLITGETGHRQGAGGAHPPPRARSAHRARRARLRGRSRALLESELFGHERGAFTGADRTEGRLFEVADGGTLFLDEIGELPLGCRRSCCACCRKARCSASAATSRAHVDVRVIAATNRDLRREVRAGRFREDLFYRLNVVPLARPAAARAPRGHRAARRALLRRSAALGRDGRPSSPRRSTRLGATTGPATCASWRTSSRPPCSSTTPASFSTCTSSAASRLAGSARVGVASTARACDGGLRAPVSPRAAQALPRARHGRRTACGRDDQARRPS